MELAAFEVDVGSVVEVEEADDESGVVCEPRPKSPKIDAKSARMFFRSLPKLEPAVDVPELPAAPADVMAELPSAAEVSICELSVGAGVVGAAGCPPWLPSTPWPAPCCWRSLKSVCTSLNKFWKSAPSDEPLELDGEPLVAVELAPLFDALGEFGSLPEAVELISNTSSSNDCVPLACEPLESVGAVFVGAVLALLLTENDNWNSVAELPMLPMLMLKTNPEPRLAAGKTVLIESQRFHLFVLTAETDRGLE